MSSKPDVMEVHGTELGGLLPANIVQAATADLKRRRGNIEVAKDDLVPAQYHHYAFLRRHVVKSDTELELIDFAIADHALGDEALGPLSGKKWTRLVYRDVETLRAARALLNNSANIG